MYPWKLGRSFESSGGQVAYDIFGQGPPLILIHGTPFWSYIWRNIAPDLAVQHTVYVYDLLGYGQSEKRAEQDVSLAAQTRVLVELLDHWGVDEPAVVGHDFGGATVLRTHLLEGRKFSRIALIDAVALTPWGSPFVQHVKKYKEALSGLPGFIHEAMVAAYIRDAVCRHMTDEELVPYLQPWLGPVGQNAFYRQIEQMDERYTDEILPYLKRITRPVLLLWGNNDRWVPPARGEQLHQMIPNSELYLIPDAAHLAQEDAPRVITSYLVQFFQAEAGAAGASRG